MKERIQRTKSYFSDKTTKIDKLLARQMKDKKRRHNDHFR